MIDLPLMENNITDEDIDVLIEFLRSNNKYTQGKNVEEFEKKWSDWLGVKHSVFVNSGSSANYITMAVIKELYGLGEIIVSPIGWSSDVASIINLGHKPVFADVKLTNLSMDIEKVLEKVTKDTKAVLLTHVLGFNAINNNLIEELSRQKILLIEDCCESHGAVYNGRKIGTFGKAANFSFYYAHHMSTIEGGMISTNDHEFYEYSRMFRSHGMTRECSNSQFRESLESNTVTYPEFTFEVPGFNMRSTELNAVVGLNQLKRLDENNQKRIENFKLFIKEIDGDKYYTDFQVKGSVNYALILIVKNENQQQYDKVVKLLVDEGVEFRRGTAGGGNLVRQPFVRKNCPSISPVDYPNSEYIHRYGLYFANYPNMEAEKIFQLCHKLNSI